MPISKIEVNEYMCLLCGYKWINRLNGKDRPIPKRCSKCKHPDWNGRRDVMTPKEIGLRTRIQNLPKLYWNHLYRTYEEDGPAIKDCWDVDTTRRFLFLLNPRPTIAELERVLYPPGLVIGIDSQNQYRVRGWVPDPEKSGWMKRDREEYRKLLDSDAQKHQEAMRKIIDERERKEKEELKVVT